MSNIEGITISCNQVLVLDALEAIRAISVRMESLMADVKVDMQTLADDVHAALANQADRIKAAVTDALAANGTDQSIIDTAIQALDVEVKGFLAANPVPAPTPVDPVPATDPAATPAG